MLKLFVLVIKLNFIVTLSGCYCTGSTSSGPDYIIPTIYESPRFCHCTSVSNNSWAPCKGRGRKEKREREPWGQNRYDTNCFFQLAPVLICHLIKLSKHVYSVMHVLSPVSSFLKHSELSFCLHRSLLSYLFQTLYIQGESHKGNLSLTLELVLACC